MTSKIGKICILAGTMMILAAGLLLLKNQHQAETAGQAAAAAFLEIQQTAPADTASGEEPTVEIDGLTYIGTVSIPAIDRELPVLARWNTADAKKAPCRYTGSVLTDDLIIAGHSYASHFGRLNRLKPGDEVVFTNAAGVGFKKIVVTNAAGVAYRYQVADQELIRGTDTASMQAGDWPLTLFTCNYGGTMRVTVRCVHE